MIFFAASTRFSSSSFSSRYADFAICYALCFDVYAISLFFDVIDMPFFFHIDAYAIYAIVNIYTLRRCLLNRSGSELARVLQGEYR